MASRNRVVTVVALVIAGLGGALLTAGAVSKSWWTSDRATHHYSVGPTGFEFCQGDQCRQRQLGDRDNPNPARIGAALLATTGLAMLLLCFVVGLGAADRLADRSWLVKTTLLACLFAGALGAAFALIRSDFEGLVAAPALYCFFSGAGVCAASMALLLSRTAQLAE